MSNGELNSIEYRKVNITLGKITHKAKEKWGWKTERKHFEQIGQQPRTQ